MNAAYLHKYSGSKKLLSKEQVNGYIQAAQYFSQQTKLLESSGFFYK
jgi:hypothetical protein